MVDRLTPERRSWLMSQVRGQNTTPEMIVRRLLLSKDTAFASIARILRVSLILCCPVIEPSFSCMAVSGTGMHDVQKQLAQRRV